MVLPSKMMSMPVRSWRSDEEKEVVLLPVAVAVVCGARVTVPAPHKHIPPLPRPLFLS